MKKLNLSHAQVILLLVVIALFILAFVISIETLVTKEAEPMYTFQEAVDRQLNNGTEDLVFNEHGYLIPASQEDITDAMRVDKRNMFEFIRIDIDSDITADEANELLRDKGVLEGTGKYFVEAEKEYDVSAVYLIAHALIETGNGHSELAKGITVDGEKYYNFFGIGAFDHAAIEEGSSFAKRGNWNSPELAIKGGAKFIRENYLDNNQNTVYKMRWNPDNPGTHLYATDIHWAGSIARNMDAFYERLSLEPAKKEEYMYKEEAE